MAVHPSGVLQHLYWGPSIAPAPRAAFPSLSFAALDVVSANNGVEVPLSLLLQEYPTANTGDPRSCALDVEHANGTADRWQGRGISSFAHRATLSRKCRKSLHPRSCREGRSVGKSLINKLFLGSGGGGSKIAVSLAFL